VQDPSRTTPVRIDADRAAGTVTLAWADGHATTYETVALRWLCPCAYCRGEAGQPGWLDSSPTLTTEQTRLVDVALVGTYAIQPTWGDGHSTGFYTFQLLRAECPCPVCTDERARRHDDHADPDAAQGTARHWHGGQG
jgi:prepilin-type processing-associated H-X9-DG protein